MKKRTNKSKLYICIIAFLLITISSCTGIGQWDYCSENGVYKSENEEIILDFKSLDGVITINGQKIPVSIGISNNLLNIDVEKHININSGAVGVSEEDILVLFQVEADKTENTLKLTAIGGKNQTDFPESILLRFVEEETYQVYESTYNTDNNGT